MNWTDVIKYQSNMNAGGQEMLPPADKEKTKRKKIFSEMESKQYIYILCETEDMQRLLKMLFQVKLPQEIRADECHYYYIMRGYLSKYERDGEKLKIYTSHPFPSRIFSFLITDYFDWKIAIQSFELFRLKKEFDPCDMISLRKKCKVTECAISELKDKIFQMKYQYDMEPVKRALGGSSNHGNIRTLVDHYVKDMGEAVPYELVSIIRDNFNSDIWKIAVQCKNCILGYFQQVLSNVLECFLKEDHFIDNFVYIAIYLDEVEKSEKEIDRYCERRIIPVIEKLQEKKAEVLQTELFNMISGNDAIVNINISLLDEMMKRTVARMEVIYNETE